MGGLNYAARRKLIAAARQRRYRMAVAYLNRRENTGPWGMHCVTAYREWVDEFPKFMMIAYPGAILRQREHDARQVRKVNDQRSQERGAAVRAASHRDPHRDQGGSASRSQGRPARPPVRGMGHRLWKVYDTWV